VKDATTGPVWALIDVETAAHDAGLIVLTPDQRGTASGPDVGALGRGAHGTELLSWFMALIRPFVPERLIKALDILTAAELRPRGHHSGGAGRDSESQRLSFRPAS
jgi:hypothetical protein